jgi:hypothetical protein
MTLRQTPSLDFLCIEKKGRVKIALKYCAKLFFFGVFFSFFGGGGLVGGHLTGHHHI